MKLKKMFLMLTLSAVAVAASSCGGKKADKTIKDENLHPSLLSGMYVVEAYGGTSAFFKMLKEGVSGTVGSETFNQNLQKAYTEILILPYRSANSSDYKKGLSEWWGVNSKEDFMETEEWLLNKGQSEDYENCRKAIDENGGANANLASIDLKKYDISQEEGMAQLQFLKDNYSKFTKSGIKAWDIARYANNINAASAAKYITDDEAKEMMKKALVEAQKYYANWNDYFSDFNLGRLFWGGDTASTFSDITTALTNPESDYSIYNYMSLK